MNTFKKKFKNLDYLKFNLNTIGSEVVSII